MIVLPVRDGGSYLRQAIESVRSQTIGRWRLLVLENHSRDATVETVRSYADDRITIMRAAHPLPIERNWARALPLLDELGVSDDVFLTFIGHDDVLAPDFLTQIDALIDQNPDASLYQTLFNLIDAAGQPIRSCRPVPARERAVDYLAALCWGIRDSFGTGYVFRAGDYRAVGGFPALPRLLYADHLLFARLTQRSYKAATTKVGCAYRLHRGSASNGLSAERMNSQLAAFHDFVEAISGEFDEIESTDLGRAALATLLARELFIFDAPGVGRLLEPENNERRRLLADRFAGLRAAPDIVSSSPFPDLSPVAIRLRRLRLSLALLRHRWGRS